MPGQGFSVTISAVDKITAPLANIGKELTQLSRNMQTFQRQTAAPSGVSTVAGGVPGPRAGFFQHATWFVQHDSRDIGKGLRDVTSEVQKTGKELAEAFEPLAKLGGIGGGLGGGLAGGLGIAGLVEGLNKLGESGRGIVQTSARIGETTTTIKRLGNAAALSGGSFEGFTSGLENFGQVLHDAAQGTNSESIAFLKQFDIAARNSDKSIRLGSGALHQLFDAFKTLKNPIDQQIFAQKAFRGACRESLPVLQKGWEAFEEQEKRGNQLDR